MTDEYKQQIERIYEINRKIQDLWWNVQERHAALEVDHYLREIRRLRIEKAKLCESINEQ